MREEEPEVQCRCLVVFDDGFDAEVRCEKSVPPDTPFCDSCGDRHPDIRGKVMAVAPNGDLVDA